MMRKKIWIIFCALIISHRTTSLAVDDIICITEHSCCSESLTFSACRKPPNPTIIESINIYLYTMQLNIFSISKPCLPAKPCNFFKRNSRFFSSYPFWHIACFFHTFRAAEPAELFDFNFLAAKRTPAILFSSENKRLNTTIFRAVFLSIIIYFKFLFAMRTYFCHLYHLVLSFIMCFGYSVIFKSAIHTAVKIAVIIFIKGV